MKSTYYILFAVSFFLMGPLFSQTKNEESNQVEKKQGKLTRFHLQRSTNQIPSDPQKLKPRFQETHLHFGYQRMIYNIWGKDYLLPPAMESELVEVRNYGYFQTPKVNQFYFGVEVKPWLKTGVITHRRQPIHSEVFLNRDENPRISGDAKLDVDFSRTWGIYAEFTPFPVKYLRVRRYELNLGGAFMKENISLRREVWVGYYTATDNWNYLSKVDISDITSYGFSFYGSFSVFVLPWLSLQSRVGYYMIPKVNVDPLQVNLPSGYPDLTFNYQPFNFSWNFYSLGLNLHL